MADTLLTVATEERDKAKGERDRVAGELNRAQADLTGAQKELGDAAKELTALQNEAAAIRRQIAQTTIAADGKKLFDKLDENTTKVRAEQAAIVALNESVASARSRIIASQAELDRATAAVAATEQALADARRADDDRTAWANAASGPLSGLPGKAEVTKSGAAKTVAAGATARLDGGKGGDIPAEVFERANDRRAKRATRLGSAVDAAEQAEDRLADESAKAGLAGERAKAGTVYARSREALRDFALTARERYDRALALLNGVAASTGLNQDEKDRIDELNQEALAANAFALEAARDDAQADLDEKNDEIAAAYLEALATDPTTDPATSAAVTAASANLDTLEQAVSDAQDALDPVQPTLDALEASIPDTTWRLFADFGEALDLLADLAAADPNALATAAADHEDAYAQALRAEQDNTRVVVALASYARERDDRAAVVAQTRTSRLLLALRGDE
jgi:hypothetical protein